MKIKNLKKTMMIKDQGYPNKRKKRMERKEKKVKHKYLNNKQFQLHNLNQQHPHPQSLLHNCPQHNLKKNLKKSRMQSKINQSNLYRSLIIMILQNCSHKVKRHIKWAKRFWPKSYRKPQLWLMIPRTISSSKSTEKRTTTWKMLWIKSTASISWELDLTQKPPILAWKWKCFWRETM